MNERMLLKILSKTDEKVKAVIFLAQSPKCWLPGCFVKLPAGGAEQMGPGLRLSPVCAS